jgi:hypothetical protein
MRRAHCEHGPRIVAGVAVDLQRANEAVELTVRLTSAKAVSAEAASN